jgi:hypothetical protein
VDASPTGIPPVHVKPQDESLYGRRDPPRSFTSSSCQPTEAEAESRAERGFSPPDHASRRPLFKILRVRAPSHSSSARTTRASRGQAICLAASGSLPSVSGSFPSATRPWRRSLNYWSRAAAAVRRTRSPRLRWVLHLQLLHPSASGGQKRSPRRRRTQQLTSCLSRRRRHRILEALPQQGKNLQGTRLCNTGVPPPKSPR